MKKKKIAGTALVISLMLLFSGCTTGGKTTYYTSPGDNIKNLGEGIRQAFLVTAEDDLAVMKNILTDLKDGADSREKQNALRGKLEIYSQLRNEDIYVCPDVYKEYNYSNMTSDEILPEELPKDMRDFGDAFSDYAKELKALVDQGAFDQADNPDFRKKNGDLLELVTQIGNDIGTLDDEDTCEKNEGRMKEAQKLVESLCGDIN